MNKARLKIKKITIPKHSNAKVQSEKTHVPSPLKIKKRNLKIERKSTMDYELRQTGFDLPIKPTFSPTKKSKRADLKKKIRSEFVLGRIKQTGLDTQNKKLRRCLSIQIKKRSLSPKKGRQGITIKLDRNKSFTLQNDLLVHRKEEQRCLQPNLSELNINKAKFELTIKRTGKKLLDNITVKRKHRKCNSVLIKKGNTRKDGKSFDSILND